MNDNDRGDTMTDVYRVKDLKRELDELDDDLPVMVCVVKYPGEFALRSDPSTGEMAWDNADDTELVPLEEGDITMQRDMVYMTVELTDYSDLRAMGITGGDSATD